MRGFASYLVAAVLVVLALHVIAPRVELGLPVGAGPIGDHGPDTQHVNRSHKSDRLNAPAMIGKQQAPSKPPVVLVGCDPVFSRLAASARANFAGRCIA